MAGWLAIMTMMMRPHNDNVNGDDADDGDADGDIDGNVDGNGSNNIKDFNNNDVAADDFIAASSAVVHVCVCYLNLSRLFIFIHIRIVHEFNENYLYSLDGLFFQKTSIRNENEM